MKTEYQTTITLVEEILAVREDREAATPMIDRMIAYMLEVSPRPQDHRDPQDAEMRRREQVLADEIFQADSPFTDVLAVPADDFLPQLYPVLVVRLLLRDHTVLFDASRIENYWEFCLRYHQLIVFDRDGRHR